MRQVTKKSARSKGVGVGRGDAVYVGLDVHKRSIHGAVRVNGREVETGVLPARAGAVLAFLEPYRLGLKQVVYEAGPTGYGLVRRLRRAGVPADVVAPGKTPRTPGVSSKSDRLDCRALARFDEAGLLKRVAVPTAREEADRQVVRLRDQVVDKRRRVKQQIKSFLLQHGLREPRGLSHWTRAAVAALERRKMAATLRFCLDMLLRDLANLEAMLGEVNRAVRRLSRTRRHARRVERLMKEPGVGPVTAMQFVTEVYQAQRFTSPREVAAYVGLAPRVRQSGERRRDGPLLKAGRGRLRAMLVEASWVRVGRDPVAKATYRRLVRNTGCANKAIVGVARRLAIRLWRLLTCPQTDAPAIRLV